MAIEDGISGRIIGWEKDQTAKTTVWFKLHKDLIHGGKLSRLSTEIRYVFVTLMSHAEQKEGVFCLSWALLRAHSGVFSKKKLCAYCVKLAESGLIETTEEKRREERRGRKKREIKKESTREEKPTKKEPTYSVSTEDLILIYNAYPRKDGKKPGLEKLRKIISSSAIFKEVLAGAHRYAAYVGGREDGLRYAKMFSTWVNQECWNDDYKAAPKVRILKSLEDIK